MNARTIRSDECTSRGGTVSNNVCIVSHGDVVTPQDVASNKCTAVGGTFVSFSSNNLICQYPIQNGKKMNKMNTK